MLLHSSLVVETVEALSLTRGMTRKKTSMVNVFVSSPGKKRSLDAVDKHMPGKSLGAAPGRVGRFPGSRPMSQEVVS